MRLLITGASGFVGSALVKHFGETFDIYAVVRGRFIGVLPSRCTVVEALTLDDIPDEILMGVDLVVHAAGVAHVQNATGVADAIYETNVAQACRLFERCGKNSVKKIVNISSIAVYGDISQEIDDFTELCPNNLYGYSKLMAEVYLKDLFVREGVQFTNLRPPLIYGLGAKGNYASVKSLLESTRHLPFPCPIPDSENRRTFLSLNGLCHAVNACVVSEITNGKSYLVADNDSISTFQFFDFVAKSLQVTIVSFHLPKIVISFVNRLPIFGKLYRKMYSDLVVVSSRELVDAGYKADIMNDLNIK